MLVVRFLFILAVVLVLVSFSAFNLEEVSLTYLPGQPPLNLPLYAVIIMFLFAGAFIAWLLSVIDRLALKRDMRGKDREIHQLRGELQALRNLPLEEDLEEDLHTESQPEEEEL